MGLSLLNGVAKGAGLDIQGGFIVRQEESILKLEPDRLAWFKK